MKTYRSIMPEKPWSVEEIADVYLNPTLIYHALFPSIMPFIHKDYPSTPWRYATKHATIIIQLTIIR
jgi:hypothetical protein